MRNVYYILNNLLNKIKHNKVTLYTLSTCVLVLFCLALNLAFSSFVHTASNAAANIKVKDMTFAMTINGTAGTIITANPNDITKSNIVLTSLNSLEAKYELIYHVCSDSSCETYINKPSALTVEYSSRTIDPITGAINASGTKQLRVVTTNTTSTTYYIKLDINAGYSYNTLTLANMISEYDEDDVTIAAYIDGTLSTTFPTTSTYLGTISCTVRGSASNAAGTASWNGSKWVVNITGADTGETRCNAYFTARTTAANDIKTLGNTTQGNGGIESISQSATSQLAATTEYRYYGTNPNNYVTFNNELWRIIGVFQTENESGTLEYRVKIMRNSYITPVSWDTSPSYTNSGYGVNEWSQADLMELLNPGYEGNSINNSLYWNRGSGNCYVRENEMQGTCDFTTTGLSTAAKDLIGKAKYYTASRESYTQTSLQAYQFERGTSVATSPSDGVTRYISWTGYVGLMYTSDYGYAADYNVCDRSTTLDNYDTVTACHTNNWFWSPTSYNEWAISPYSSILNHVWYLNVSGEVSAPYAYNQVWFRPVVFLKTSVKITGGGGTSSDPFTLSL